MQKIRKFQSLLINIEVLFDLKSFYWSCTKFVLAKHQKKLDLKKEFDLKPLKQALTRLEEEIGEPERPKVLSEIKDLIKSYARTIKPRINSYAFTEHLKAFDCSYELYSTEAPTPEEIFLLSELKQTFSKFFKMESIPPLSEALKNRTSQKETIILDCNPENLEIFDDKEFLRALIVNSKALKKHFEDEKDYRIGLEIKGILVFDSLETISLPLPGLLFAYPQLKYAVEGRNQPANKEVALWESYKRFDPPIIIQSEVVKGFGRGSKQLGVPTANLQMTKEISELLRDHFTGIHFGTAQFVSTKNTDDITKYEKDYEKIYPMCMSIGYNPYFDNTEKTCEVHIIDHFDEDFYGASLRVDIQGYIRNEADFFEFTYLIESIHNDIQFTKTLVAGKKL